MRCRNWMRGQLSQILSCVCFSPLLLLLVKAGDAADVSSDSIVLGASLTGSQTRISKNGVFKLGFFNLTNNNVKKWYVGIWYATATQQTIAWVANRERPLQNTSAVFNLTEDGSLLLSYGGSIFWSSEANGKKPSSAMIMDSGNLVVVSAENASEYIWESFDHPGNTWLPGMKISVRQRLTSWRDPWDPSQGLFTLQMDPNGANQYVLLWKNHIKYWESGVWNGRIFSNVAEMSTNYMYNFGFYNNGSYKYFTYSLMHGFTKLSRFVMDQSGEIRVSIALANNEWSMIWQQPRDLCNVYAACGPYGLCNGNNVQSCNCVAGFIPRNRREWESQQSSSGCVQKTPLRCSHDGFVELSVQSMPPQGFQYKGQGQRQRQCQEACLSDCSCKAFAYVFSGSSHECVMWFGELLNMYDTSNGTSLFLQLDASDLPDSSNSKKKTTHLAGLVGGIVGGLVAILALVLLLL